MGFFDPFGAAPQQGGGGERGKDGRGILSVELDTTGGKRSSAKGGAATEKLTKTYRINFSDGASSTFEVSDGINGKDGIDGKDGKGIKSIRKTSSSGVVDVYTITFTDNSTFSFNVTNGINGEKGETGDKGDKGDKGDTGRAFVYSDFTKE